MNNLLWLSLNFPWFSFFLTDFIVFNCYCFGISPSSILLNRTARLFAISFPHSANSFCFTTYSNSCFLSLNFVSLILDHIFSDCFFSLISSFKIFVICFSTFYFVCCSSDIITSFVLEVPCST